MHNQHGWIDDQRRPARPSVEAARQAIWESFKAGSLDDDEATAQLLALALAERQARLRGGLGGSAWGHQPDGLADAA